MRLVFKLSVGAFASADALRTKLIAALKSSPHFILVGEPERAVSSAFAGGTTASYGSAFVEATVRYNGSADGMTYDVTLRPYDKAVTDAFGFTLVALYDAGVIGSTYSTQAPVGMQSAQELAKGSKSPADKVADALTKPLSDAKDTVDYLSFAIIAGALAFVVWKGAPVLRGVGKAFQRARK